MIKESTATAPSPASDSPAPVSDRHGPTVLLSVVLAVVLLIYAVCLFKQISYPLMWADESMTAVGAQRVLEFGYPKVHDGRNIFYDLRHTDLSLGIDEKTDSYIGGAGWTPYYFAAPFVAVSQSLSDLYLKTAMLRVPFALAGLAGMLLLLRTGTRALPTTFNRLAAAVLFVMLELPSVTLMLHLREVRYYSLQLLLTAIALSTFAAWHLFSSIRYRVYAVTVFCLVPLLFLTFSPASAAFCVTIGLYLGGEWIMSALRRRRDSLPSLRGHLKSLAPALASLALVVPLAWFFRTLSISRRLAEFYDYSLDTYLEHLGVVFSYFARFDIILFAIAAKLLLFAFWRRVRNDAGLLPAVKLSVLFSLYFVVHALLIAKIPNRLFTRYFITLQPVLMVTFALDLLILARIWLEMEGRKRMAGAAIVAVLLVGSIGFSFTRNLQLIRGRLYEISHQYQGVLDFAIPYIREHYKHPDRLVIATNYEETSYIYYLGCRVIVGFLNMNPRADIQERPDCIIYRGFWSQLTDAAPFEEFVKRDRYEMARFPVLDYGFNNIPEAVHWTPETGWEWGLHLFMTAYSNDPQSQAVIYLRRSDAAQPPLPHGSKQ